LGNILSEKRLTFLTTNPLPSLIHSIISLFKGSHIISYVFSKKFGIFTWVFVPPLEFNKFSCFSGMLLFFDVLFYFSENIFDYKELLFAFSGEKIF
jgi:hypothetical protein